MTLIQNWHPLSVLNTLYNLISSILAFRLKHVLARLLGLHQRAYIPGRYIGEVTRNVYDAFSLAEQKNNYGLAFMVDFEKAFDLVLFDFINVTLELFGFGPVYKKWVNILLGQGQGFKGGTIVNGHVSEQLAISRGCRQGDPITWYLFVLCIEVLVLLI